MSIETYWGIDLGGTKIECIVLNAQLECIIRKRIPTEAEHGYNHLLQRVKLLIDDISTTLRVYPNKIGFSTPGALDINTALMKYCNTTSLNNMPLKQSLEQLLKIPCIVENDANCFAYAETHLGVVKQHYPEVKSVFGIILGTGVGAGLTYKGEVINGPNQSTGEWGHNILHANGHDCYCGKKGCVETYISGTGVQKHYSQITGKQLTVQEIVKKAETNEKAAVDTIDFLQQNFGKALARVINILDPDIIIIGGGVGNINSLYTHGRDAIMQELFSTTLNTDIVPPILGDSAGVYGAALLTKIGVYATDLQAYN